MLLKDTSQVVCDEDGYLFIDRDGSYFGPLLNFLRTGELDLPPHVARRLVEREALFYLIDLSGCHSDVSNPLSKTGASWGGLVHADLRFDGCYVQRHPQSGVFVGYYIFSRPPSEEVRYRSLHSANANDLVYGRAARYTRLRHPWLVMHWGTQSHPQKMIASVRSHGLSVEWRYPPRAEHRRQSDLTFWPSVEPMMGVLYSDEQHRCATSSHYVSLRF